MRLDHLLSRENSLAEKETNLLRGGPSTPVRFAGPRDEVAASGPEGSPPRPHLESRIA